MKRKKIILFERSEIIRMGFEKLFSQHNNYIEIIKTVYSIEQLQDSIIAYQPNVIVLNPAHTGSSTQYIVNNIRKQYSNISIIALLYSYLEKETLDCFDATIELYDSTSHILEQIELIEDKTEQNNSLNNSEGEELSPRENAIVALVAKGHTNKEIADMLNISVHTVITHRKNISKKTGIKSISGLTMYAMLNKLI